MMKKGKFKGYVKRSECFKMNVISVCDECMEKKMKKTKVLRFTKTRAICPNCGNYWVMKE